MWAEERTDELKRRWLAGQTASTIAAAMGGLTRNAIIGKVHRLGLPSDNHRSSGSVRRFDSDAILDLWFAGLTRAAIAAKTGCSVGTISRNVSRARASDDIRATRWAKGPRRKLTSEQRAEIVAAYAPRPTLNELAAAYGVSTKTIRRILSEARKAA